MLRTTLILCLPIAVMLVGCDDKGSPFRSEPIKATTLEGKIRGSRNGGEEVRVWRDPATGCQYLMWERRREGSMTPRLMPDGRPMCGPVQSAE
ncbi:DUF6440 family protein [Sandarakinorhabdus sp.]|uniref:DUF6440 family protein n=1 Tax=Sandarakinorhabdus sp. TaxID=1916663 RepID=UPI0038F5F241